MCSLRVSLILCKIEASVVDFPEPEAPTMAVNLPFSTPRVIPSRAFT